MSMSCSTAGRWWLVFWWISGERSPGGWWRGVVQILRWESVGDLEACLWIEAGRSGSQILRDGRDRRRVSCERERETEREGERGMHLEYLAWQFAWFACLVCLLGCVLELAWTWLGLGTCRVFRQSKTGWRWLFFFFLFWNRGVESESVCVLFFLESGGRWKVELQKWKWKVEWKCEGWVKKKKREEKKKEEEEKWKGQREPFLYPRNAAMVVGWRTEKKSVKKKEAVGQVCSKDRVRECVCVEGDSEKNKTK